MAPQKSSSRNDGKKQVTLKTWFAKSTSNDKDVGPGVQSLASGTRSEPKTPESKKTDVRILNSSALRSPASSDIGFSAMETPPTSDPIDIDMMSVDEEPKERVRVGIVSAGSMILSTFVFQGQLLCFGVCGGEAVTFCLIIRIALCLIIMFSDNSRIARLTASVKSCWRIRIRI
jgi:hypothetical protein